MSKRRPGVYGEKRFLKWDTLNARGSKGGFGNLLDNRVLGLLAMEEGAFSLSLAGLRIVRMALSGHDPNLGVGRGDS